MSDWDQGCQRGSWRLAALGQGSRVASVAARGWLRSANALRTLGANAAGEGTIFAPPSDIPLWG